MFEKFGWMAGDPYYMVKKGEKYLKTISGIYSSNQEKCIAFLHEGSAIEQANLHNGYVVTYR